MAQTYNHTIDNINFAIEDNARKTFPKLSHSSSDAESGLFEKIINAVEIDWNDAELGEVNGIPLGTIKTTGDLIKVIQG